MQKTNNILTTPSSALFITRGNRVQFYNFETEQIEKEIEFTANAEQLELKSQVSPNRNYYLVYSSSEFLILDLKGDVITRVQEKGICKVKFIENSDKYLIKITKFETTYTLTLFSFEAGKMEKIEKFEIQFFKQNFEYLKYDFKSGFFGVQVSQNLIEIYSVVHGKLFLEHEHKENTNIVDFYVRKNYLYVSIDDVKDGKPTISVCIYKLGEKLVLEYKRVFNNVQETKIYLSDDGNTALVNAHRFMDTTGNSYYGLEKVFYYNQNIKKFDDVISFKGSIHDIKMDPSEKYFIVISGSVPSYTVLYDTRNSALFMMSHDFRNQIYFAPNKAFVAIVGFGSLNGEIEIWNYLKREQIGFCTSSLASFLKWSSDSSMFVTATIVDKLKVDHRFSIFSYNGTLLKKVQFKIFDLINVDFAFNFQTNTSIIDNPECQKKEGVNIMIKNKVEAQKIDNEKIKHFTPGDLTFTKVSNGKPSLTVGNAQPIISKEPTGLFFNSKKDGGANKFKVKK